MIVDDFDVKRVPLRPSEADPPSFVDTNAVLALPVPFQRFESVAGRGGQILQNPSPVKIQQLSPRRPLKRLEPNHGQVIEEALGSFVFEGLDHGASIIRIT